MSLKISTRIIIAILMSLTLYGLLAILIQYYAFNSLSKTRSEETLEMFSESAFQTLRATMNLGSSELVEHAVDRAKSIPGVFGLSVLKSKEIIELFESEIPYTTDPDILKVFETKEPKIITTQTSEHHLARILKPFPAQEVCINCHINANVGEILGVMDLTISLDESDKQIQSFLQNTAIIMFLIGAAIATFLLIQVRRVFMNPMSKLTHAVVTVEKTGDLSQRITYEKDDEVGMTIKAFNSLLTSFSGVISKINKNSEALTIASKELSATTSEIRSTAEDANRGTSLAAQSSRDIAENIQELAETFKHISETVFEIQGSALTAGEGASHGTDAGKATSASITKIAESSHQIEGIMEVITEIANQTNLLSLNAAIEAAKAGEFGKGFAVVADEVRSLAERSSDSVEKIRALIEVSSSDVAEGTIVVEQTVDAFNVIIAQISEISEKIQDVAQRRVIQDERVISISSKTTEITTANESNAVAMDELSHSLKELDITTEELSDMAVDLKNQVAVFKT